MKIYTSYFSKVNKLKENGIVPIGICAYPPSFFDGPNLAAVAPPKNLLKGIKNGKITEEQYTETYKAYLTRYFKDFHVLIERIISITDGKDAALCCYEKPGDFCHRHILAEMINKQYDIDVKEWTEDVDLYKPLF